MDGPAPNFRARRRPWPAPPQRRQGRNDEALARRQLADATIRAPFDGVVVSRAVAPGQVVAARHAAAGTRHGLDRLVVTVPLPAADAQRLASNARAHVLLSGMADKVRTARLVRIDPTDDARPRSAGSLRARSPAAGDAAWCNCARAWPRRWKSTCRARRRAAGSQRSAGLHARRRTAASQRDLRAIW
jgi:multidrug efflux pump subunit AcrA (membrane-fusion protein)